MNELPKTIRDAVLVAEICGINLIWVDAPCKIYDNKADKSPEVANMPYVYDDSTLVISASKAKSAEKGFLGPRFSMGRDTRRNSSRQPLKTKAMLLTWL
jgi:hypothetical protein